MTDNNSPAAEGKTASDRTASAKLDASVSDPSPKDSGKPAATGDASAGSTDKEATDPPTVKWGKRILVIAGAIVTIGGAVAVISQTTHLLNGLFGSSPPVSEIVVSPVLGLSFYQNGDLDPMSYSAPNPADVTVSVSMHAEPFELFFPTLDTDSSLNICTSESSSIFSTATVNVQTNNSSCLNAYNSAADYGHASGTLFETVGQYIVHTAIEGDRTQPASGGDEQYYVSNLASRSNVVQLTHEHGTLYLVAYLNTNNYNSFQADNVEYFILKFG